MHENTSNQKRQSKLNNNKHFLNGPLSKNAQKVPRAISTLETYLSFDRLPANFPTDYNGETYM